MKKVATSCGCKVDAQPSEQILVIKRRSEQTQCKVFSVCLSLLCADFVFNRHPWLVVTPIQGNGVVRNGLRSVLEWPRVLKLPVPTEPSA